ncbi:tyrosine-type recombinase/integrase [Streptomyces brevispora]|uniref:tyrosine-type recombinase/integrase n=1 Tax=Streptomyces brevispora TaxID=887462 RepID=UPI0035DD2CD7
MVVGFGVDAAGRLLLQCSFYAPRRPAGERGHPHTAFANTRHACATHNYERGRSLWKVQKMLGHDRPTTTASYLATAHMRTRRWPAWPPPGGPCSDS